MKHQINVSQVPLQYNDCVKQAYLQVLKQAKQMLATIEQDELRCTLERSVSSTQLKQEVIHEFINPLLFLKLECCADGLLAIHFGIEEIGVPGQQSSITSAFLRLLYKVTMRDAFAVDIERCVKTNWFLRNTCSEVFEYLEERNNLYTFRKIKYKQSPRKGNRLLSVA